jgi:TMEM175 potassium channel family protein
LLSFLPYFTWVAEGIFVIFYVLGWFVHNLSYRHHPEGRYLAGTVRMCSITDNMTAVAITFLIASITGALLSNAQQSFSTALGAVLAALPVYGLTFLIVGFFWLSHHRIFMVIRRHDMTLIWLNFAFLVCIELQPLFNALQASYAASQTTSILYAAEQVATGLMLLVIWGYAAIGHRLIDRAMDGFDIMTFALRALLIPLIFILSIAIIVYRHDLVFSFWLLVILLEVADLVYRRVRHRPHSEVYAEADG